MTRGLRNCGLRALGLVLVAIAVGCASDTALARPELTTEQTVAMVRAGRFSALDRYYTEVQRDYDKGSISDQRLRSAFRHFYNTSSDLAARYGAWVEATPKSYVAHLARAIYYLRVGEASRGNLVIADTSETQLRAMDVAFATASRELEKSMSLEKRPLLSVFYLLDIGMFEGNAARNQALFQRSLGIDRRNFIAREMYMRTLQTAWGGSTEQLKAFVADNRTAGLSTRRMNDLQSLVFADEAWIDEVRNGNYERAAKEYLEAAKLSSDAACMLCAGRVLVKAQDFPVAARVLTQYLARDPKSTDAWKLRLYADSKLGRPTDEAQDYKRLAELGDANSQYLLATMYLVGQDGIPRDRKEGVRWLKRSAAQGYSYATKLLPFALNQRYEIISSDGGMSIGAIAAIKSQGSSPAAVQGAAEN